MKQLAVASALAGVIALPGTVFADECGEVSITEMDWASSIIVTHVSKFLMEQGYGCDVTTVPSSVLPSITSLAETGKPEIITEFWVNSTPVYEEMVEAGTIMPLADVLSDGGEEGWWVPNYMIEKHPEMATIEGILAHPEWSGGRLHNCPDGWGCERANDSLAKALDLESKGIEVFKHGSGETLATSIAAAFEDKAPWLGYYWAPTSVLGKYPMTKIKIGEVKPDVHACNMSPDCAAVGVSDYPPSPVKTVVSTKFYNDNPEIAELMSKVSFSNAQMGDVLAWQEDHNASAEEAAVYFLTTYSSVWPNWLNESAKEKLSALIN